MRIQFISRVDHNETAYMNLLNYIRHPDKCTGGIFGATNVFIDPNASIEQSVYMTAEYIRKRQSCDTKLAVHLIIEFSPSELEYLDENKILETGYVISQLDMAECITFFGVHDHSEHLHLDMMICPYSIYTGKAWHLSKSFLWKIGLDIKEHLIHYMPEEAISKLQTVWGRT